MIPENVFRYEALDTQTLDYLIDEKNKKTDVYSYDVLAANHIPAAFQESDEDAYNWISNTDESNKPGTHWVCVWVEQDWVDDCVKRKVNIIDSWGVNSEKTCENIVNNITDSYHEYLSYHSKFVVGKSCKCSMLIDFPVKYRIQYSSYENCGWFALHFSCMNKQDLHAWINSPLNGYGQITNNYRNMVGFFRDSFFKNKLENVHFNTYKCHIRTLQEKKKIKCNQCCTTFNCCCMK